MDYVYVFVGMFVSVIALFKRDLLVQKRSFKIVLALAIVLFVVALLLHRVDSTPSLSGALLTPLLSLLLFRLCRSAFLRLYNREPRDTWFNWTKGMGADRTFNIVYFGSSIWLELLAMGTMIEVSKIG